MPTKLNRRQILASSAIALTGAYCARPEQAGETAAPAPAPAETPSGKPLTSAEVRGGDRERLKEISERMDRILPTLH